MLPASPAVACPLCYEAARQVVTIGQQLDTTDRVVLAAPDEQVGLDKTLAGIPFEALRLRKNNQASGRRSVRRDHHCGLDPGVAPVR
jgi:hypothetical protein